MTNLSFYYANYATPLDCSVCNNKHSARIAITLPTFGVQDLCENCLISLLEQAMMDNLRFKLTTTEEVSITEVINNLINKFGDEPIVINAGDCYEFACAVVQQVPNAKVLWDSELDEKFKPMYLSTGHHAFVKYKDKYYDAECPEGINDFHDLPFYKRFTKSWH